MVLIDYAHSMTIISILSPRDIFINIPCFFLKVFAYFALIFCCRSSLMDTSLADILHSSCGPCKTLLMCCSPMSSLALTGTTLPLSPFTLQSTTWSPLLTTIKTDHLPAHCHHLLIPFLVFLISAQSLSQSCKAWTHQTLSWMRFIGWRLLQTLLGWPGLWLWLCWGRWSWMRAASSLSWGMSRLWVLTVQ